MKNKIQNSIGLTVLSLVLLSSTWANAQSSPPTTTVVPAGGTLTMSGSDPSTPGTATPKEKAKILSTLAPAVHPAAPVAPAPTTVVVRTVAPVAQQ